MNTIMKATLLLILFFLITVFVNGQVPIMAPFDTAHWNIQAKETRIEVFNGYSCLAMTGGIAQLKDNFENGIIEFDISFEKDRIFPGLMFRIEDDKNFEFLYFRPHQSGNPDAIQYCPILFNNDTWQLYGGDGFCAQTDFAFNTWIHVKIIISGKMGELYLDRKPEPILFMNRLIRDPLMGGLALDNRSPSLVRFANFSYTKQGDPELKSTPKKLPAVEAGLVSTWQVSSSFGEETLDKKFTLREADCDELKWQVIEAEELGFINIGEHIAKSPEKNTVFTKFSLHSGKSQIKKMALGFSDRCKVYLNGKLLYAGSNTFKSRDYRFYGTIGFWDEVYLDLKKGSNEVIVAVSENFGGWGVEAKFDDLQDLIIAK